MSRADDKRELALKVLGWTLSQFDEHGHDWRPFSDANDVLRVVDAMHSLGHGIEYTFGKLNYHMARFYQMNGGRENGRWTSADDFCEAVCNAALAAVRSKP